MDTINTAGLLLERKDGKFLFQLRDDIPGILYPGCWGLFGGHLEEGESPEEGAIRELYEELGVQLTTEELGQPKVVPRTKEGIKYVYHVSREWYAEPLVLKEGQAMAWFSISEILSKKNLVSSLPRDLKMLTSKNSP